MTDDGIKKLVERIELACGKIEPTTPEGIADQHEIMHGGDAYDAEGFFRPLSCARLDFMANKIREFVAEKLAKAEAEIVALRRQLHGFTSLKLNESEIGKTAAAYAIHESIGRYGRIQGEGDGL